MDKLCKNWGGCLEKCGDHALACAMKGSSNEAFEWLLSKNVPIGLKSFLTATALDEPKYLQQLADKDPEIIKKHGDEGLAEALFPQKATYLNGRGYNQTWGFGPGTRQKSLAESILSSIPLKSLTWLINSGAKMDQNAVRSLYSRSSQVDGLSEILDAGIDINAHDSRNLTALSISVSKK